MQLLQVLEEAVQNPPIPFEPEKQSLKAWAMYCLRSRGFKVVYAQNADFAIETRTDKLYFRVTDQATDVDADYGWIIWDPTTRHCQVVVPQT